MITGLNIANHTSNYECMSNTKVSITFKEGDLVGRSICFAKPMTSIQMYIWIAIQTFITLHLYPTLCVVLWTCEISIPTPLLCVVCFGHVKYPDSWGEQSNSNGCTSKESDQNNLHLGQFSLTSIRARSLHCKLYFIFITNPSARFVVHLNFQPGNGGSQRSLHLRVCRQIFCSKT